LAVTDPNMLDKLGHRSARIVSDYDPFNS
jgi:hypothetical protein